MNARRLAIVGPPDSGKSTLSRALAQGLGVAHVELDALYHQANWTPQDPDTFRAAVDEALSAGSWVVDGNFRHLLGDRVLLAADHVVWLDLPRRVVLPRLLQRTVRDGLTRRELWNGNREHLRNLVSRDPHRNILLWTVGQWSAYRETLEAVFADPSLNKTTRLRLRTDQEVADFLAEALSR